MKTKKNGKKKKISSYLIEYDVKGHITEWDDATFDDCYGDEIEEAEKIEEKAAGEFDCKERIKGAIFQDLKSANSAAEKEMKRQLDRVKKSSESSSLTLLSKHHELGASSKKPDVSPINKTLLNGRVTLNATVKFVVDGVGADLQNIADVDVTVSVVEL